MHFFTNDLILSGSIALLELVIYNEMENNTIQRLLESVKEKLLFSTSMKLL